MDLGGTENGISKQDSCSSTFSINRSVELLRDRQQGGFSSGSYNILSAIIRLEIGQTSQKKLINLRKNYLQCEDKML